MTERDKKDMDRYEGTIEPIDVLYHYDAPLIFTSKIGFFNTIFCKVDELENSDLYIATNVSSETLSALRSGRLSVRGVFVQKQVFLVELGSDFSVLAYEECEKNRIPEDYLPDPGAGLFAQFGIVPDMLQESKAFFSMNFRGDALASERIPFSVFKNIIDNAYNTSKKILTPQNLMSARSSTFDFAITQPQFGSLIITVDKPILEEKKLKRLLNHLNIEDVKMEIFRRRNEFFQGFIELIKELEKGDLSKEFAEENYFLLDQIITISPSGKNSINSVELAAGIDGKTEQAALNERTGIRVHQAHELVQHEKITDKGVIVEINSPSKTFVLSSIRGRQVTCQASDFFDELQKNENFQIGRKFIVRGYLTKRHRRDLLKVEVLPHFVD